MSTIEASTPRTLPINSLVSAEQWLKPRVSNDLFIHSQNVATKAKQIGQELGFPESYLHRLALSGFLHDCAKELINDEMLELAKKHNVEITLIDKAIPNELHPKVGAVLAKTDFGLEDTLVLEGIEAHSYGVPHMTDLQKIVLIADDTAEGRDEKNIRLILEGLDGKQKNLDRAVIVALSIKLQDLGKKKANKPEKVRPLHPNFITSWQFYNSLPL